MNRQEIQNLVVRAFEVGCEVGSASWQIDRCVSESEEKKIAKRTDELVAEFESSTGFSLGCTPNEPLVELFNHLKKNSHPISTEDVEKKLLSGSTRATVVEEPVVVKKKNRYSRRL